MCPMRGNHRTEAWEGVVVDKSRGMTDGPAMDHHLEIRLPDGSTKRVRVGGDFWKSVGKGDAVIKTAGGEPARK
ncbi:DUF7489 domain-containing protein [Catenulispora subtropica]